MPTYTVKFDRIGRAHPAPLVVKCTDEPSLVNRIARHARRAVSAKSAVVTMQAGARAGYVACGLHASGRFTITVSPPEDAATPGTPDSAAAG